MLAYLHNFPLRHEADEFAQTEIGSIVFELAKDFGASHIVRAHGYVYYHCIPITIQPTTNPLSLSSLPQNNSLGQRLAENGVLILVAQRHNFPHPPPPILGHVILRHPVQYLGLNVFIQVP